MFTLVWVHYSVRWLCTTFGALSEKLCNFTPRRRETGTPVSRCRTETQRTWPRSGCHPLLVFLLTHQETNKYTQSLFIFEVPCILHVVTLHGPEFLNNQTITTLIKTRNRNISETLLKSQPYYNIEKESQLRVPDRLIGVGPTHGFLP